MENETLYISTVFAAGIISFFSPCIVPLLPVYFSVFASNGDGKVQKKEHNRLRVFVKSILFVAGISVCFILLGFGAGVLGSFISGRVFMTIIGGIVIALGIHQTGLLHIKWLSYEKKVEIKRSGREDYFSAFLLGLTFSFGWTPCIGPILGAILGISVSGSQPFYGAFLMAIYSLGFLIPFLILAAFSDVLLRRIKRISKYLGKIKVVGGIIIIFMGIMLMTDSLYLLVRLFE